MLEVIFACNEDGLIGQNNSIPWKISQDLKFFKLTTENHVVIMGRKTFESLGKPLKNRINIVVSKTLRDDKKDLFFVNSLKEALDFSKKFYPNKEIFVIGGKKLIEEALPIADEVYRTLVHFKPQKTDSDVYVSREFENQMHLAVQMPGTENGINFEISYFDRHLHSQPQPQDSGSI